MDRVLIQIPLSVEPVERGERFDLPLCDLFDETDGGDVIAGGTSVEDGNISGVSIEIELKDMALLADVAHVLIAGGAPTSTQICFGSQFEEVMQLRDLVAE